MECFAKIVSHVCRLSGPRMDASCTNPFCETRYGLKDEGLRDEVRWGALINQAAIVNFGKSEWLLSFSQQHLARCKHYRLMFYDGYLDVICENITAENGPYHSSAR